MITHNWIPNNFVAVVPIDDLENEEEEHVEFQHEESTYHVKDTFKTEEKVETNIHIHVAEEPTLEQISHNADNQNNIDIKEAKATEER